MELFKKNGSNARSKTGQYVTQPQGYKTFVPNPLPPQPPIDIDGDLFSLLSQTDRMLGRLDGAIQILPNADVFVPMYIRREAVLSSQIEGARSSLHEILSAESEIRGPIQSRSLRKTINYMHAIDHGLQRLETVPLCIGLIQDIQTKLMQEDQGGQSQTGKLRQNQSWVGAPGCTPYDADFVPPPPEKVPKLLNNLETFLGQPDSLPTLVWMGLTHAQFETIHPFHDGNGRIGRLLIPLMFHSQKILHKPVLYLSLFLKKHRQEYYQHLQAIRDDGDWKGWLAFFLRGVCEVSADAVATTSQLVALREQHRFLITERFGRASGNGHLVLEELYQRPILAVSDIVKLTEVSYSAANNLIMRFVEAGILEEMTGYKRNRRFLYKPYIQLFTDSEGLFYDAA